MKPIKFLPIVMIAAAGLVASCSTSKLASTAPSDDVYNTVAKAKEVEPYIPQQNQNQNQYQGQNQEGYDEYYGTSNPYYDMDYASRINRFHNGFSWQGYYDPYFDNYYYGNSYGPTTYLGYGNGWYNGYGLGGWGGGFGLSIWSNPFYYGNYGYGWNNPWGWNSWGPNSYYDRYGWGGGWYGGGWGVGGGYYGGGVYTNRGNYRPRPGSNDNGLPRTSTPTNGNFGRPSRSGYAGNGNGAVSSTNPNNGRPTRSYQPQNNGRTSVPAERPTQISRPTRSESPAPSYSPPSNSGGGGSSSGGGGGGGGRPSRAGRG